MTDTVNKQALYRKKPVEVEAFRMGIDPRPDWFQDKVSTNEIITYRVAGENDNGPFGFSKTYCEIKTLEGTMRGDYGDWIIKGVQDEVYPCKPDIFAATYEPADTPPTTPVQGYREALEWYGNKENYMKPMSGLKAAGIEPIALDYGERARQALSQTDIQPSGWIPVSIQPVPGDGLYIVTDGSTTTYGHWSGGIGDITHWMPLPVPPGIKSTEDQPGPSISTEEEETDV